MIQDSINQMLTTAGQFSVIGKRIQQGNVIQKDADFNTALETYKSHQATQQELDKAMLAYNDLEKAGELTPDDIKARDVLKNQIESHQKAGIPIKQQVEDLSLNNDKYNMMYEEAQQIPYRDTLKLMRDRAENRLQAGLESKVDQVDKFKQFTETVANGYSRHGKGQQLSNYTEQARKLLNKKGGKD